MLVHPRNHARGVRADGGLHAGRSRCGRGRRLDSGRSSFMTVAGLRERKKQKTKAAIQRAALRLFKRQGYEETTVEQIAAAADISESTFFNYFPSKEDVVIYDEYDPQIFAALATGKHDEPLAKSIEKLIGTLGGV